MVRKFACQKNTPKYVLGTQKKTKVILLSMLTTLILLMLLTSTSCTSSRLHLNTFWRTEFYRDYSNHFCNAKVVSGNEGMYKPSICTFLLTIVAIYYGFVGKCTIHAVSKCEMSQQHMDCGRQFHVFLLHLKKKRNFLLNMAIQ